MSFDTEQFILEIQQNECIWNKQVKSHHDLQELHVAWTNVTRTCTYDFDNLDDKKKSEKIKELKLKWKNIRDSYRKKCVKKSGQATKLDKKYIYADILEFMRPSMENRKTEGNVAESDTEIIDTDNEAVVRSSEVDVDISTIGSEEYSTKRFTKKRKTNDSFEDRLIKMLEDRKTTEDPVTSFLMSLAPQIRSLTQDQQNQIYIDFINTIQRVKYSNSSIPFQTSYLPQSVNTYNPMPSEHLPLTQNITHPYYSYHSHHNIPPASSSSAHLQPPLTQPNSVMLNEYPSDPTCFSQNNST